jgi:hypothetical protein
MVLEVPRPPSLESFLPTVLSYLYLGVSRLYVKDSLPIVFVFSPRTLLVPCFSHVGLRRQEARQREAERPGSGKRIVGPVRSSPQLWDEAVSAHSRACIAVAFIAKS